MSGTERRMVFDGRGAKETERKIQDLKKEEWEEERENRE